jgi:phage repressor protein C with HTH and peptisase S24 domain
VLAGKPNTALVFEGRAFVVICPVMNLQVTSDPMHVSFPNGLAEAMAVHGISQAALAKAANTSQQQIGKLVHGKREMTALWANRLAPHLAVAPEILVFPELRRVRAPLLSWAGARRLAQKEDVGKADVKKFVWAADLPKGDWIVLQVEGDSMDRVAPDGSYIFVNRSDDRLINDKFYVFAMPQGDATFKRYRSGTPARLQPYSTNPDHETIVASVGIDVIGRVRRVSRDLL